MFINDVVLLVIWAILIPCLLFIFFTTYLSFKIGKSKGLALALLFWGSLYWIKIGSHETKRKWEIASVEPCRAAVRSMPEKFSVESVYLKDAVLSLETVTFLLAEQNLDFVEASRWVFDEHARRASVSKQEDAIKGVKSGSGISSKGKKYFLSTKTSDGYRPWMKTETDKPIARISLSKKGDPDCTELHPDYFNKRPYLPDNCLKISYHDSPQAQYVLALQPSRYRGLPVLSAYGSWDLIERNSHSVKASVPTYEESGGNVAFIDREYFTEKRTGGLHYCEHVGTNSRALLPALAGDKSKNRDIPFVVSKVYVDINPESDLESHEAPVAKSLNVEPESPNYADHGYQYPYSDELWAKAVDQARSNGFGAFGTDILDWESRTLINARLRESRSPGTNWKVSPYGNGFIAWNSREWRRDDALLVILYSKDGKHLSSARIEAPVANKADYTFYEPEGMFVERNRLVITARPCSAGRCQTVHREVRLSDLPESFHPKL